MHITHDNRNLHSVSKKTFKNKLKNMADLNIFVWIIYFYRRRMENGYNSPFKINQNPLQKYKVIYCVVIKNRHLRFYYFKTFYLVKCRYYRNNF